MGTLSWASQNTCGTRVVVILRCPFKKIDGKALSCSESNSYVHNYILDADCIAYRLSTKGKRARNASKSCEL
jgi:hypothetical protein